MLTTTNYKFKKPELTDSPPDITATNTNWDTLDTTLKDAQDKANAWNTFKANGGDIGGSVGVKGLRIVSDIKDKLYSQYYNSSLNSLIGVINGNEQYQQSETEFSPVFSGTPKTLGSLDVQWKDIFLTGYSKGSYGYTKLPNGFILQWGSHTTSFASGYSDVPINYPIAFPNACCVVIPNISHIGGGDVTELKGHSANTITNIGFRYSSRYSLTGNWQYTMNWIAIGY